MFNLDQAVAEWRRQMLAVGIKTPVPLDELESHLHEEIEEQMKSGLNAQQAFDAGVLKIGQAHALKNEFNKVDGETEAQKQRLIRIYFVICEPRLHHSACVVRPRAYPVPGGCRTGGIGGGEHIPTDYL